MILTIRKTRRRYAARPLMWSRCPGPASGAGEVSHNRAEIVRSRDARPFLRIDDRTAYNRIPQGWLRR
jgi:hypothetical protein